MNPIQEKILRGLYYVDYWLIIFSLLLLRLPIAFGHRYDLVSRLDELVPFILLIIYKLILFGKKVPRPAGKRTDLIVIALWGGLWAIAFGRSAIALSGYQTLFVLIKLTRLLVVGIFLYLAFANAFLLGRLEQLARAFLYGLGLYLLVNVLLYSIGVHPGAGIYLANYPAQMLSWLGISTDRVLFPMADGINNFGIFSGLVLVVLFPQLLSQHRPRDIAVVVLFLLGAVSVLLLADTRGAVVFAGLTIVLALLPPHWFKRLQWLPFLISLLPVMILVVAPGLYSNEITWLSRGETQWHDPARVGDTLSECATSLENASGSLSNRPLIWRVVLDDLAAPRWIHLVGYGYRGQMVSGVSDLYRCLFASYHFPELATAHNLWLQSAMDVGYIGMIVTLGLMVVLLRNFTDGWQGGGIPVHKSTALGLIYILCAGSLEALFSMDFSEISIFILYAVALVMNGSHKAHETIER
ncbi:MAG: O-antigen ligase family protein [Anaerolineales bacterium]|nr:O-antigen ligase family protein [Anaerolineales bacterium]